MSIFGAVIGCGRKENDLSLCFIRIVPRTIGKMAIKRVSHEKREKNGKIVPALFIIWKDFVT